VDKEDLQEFIRRLNAEGYTFQPSPDGIGAVSDENGMDVSIEGDGAILYKRESKPLAMDVMEIYNQVMEYMPAFRKAPQDAAAQHGWLDDTRTLLMYNNYEMAASRFFDGNMMFITWRLDSNGSRETEHYYDSYIDAKQDFVVRAELINKDMLFSEQELTVIRSGLSDYLSAEDTFVTGSQEDAIKEVIGKIDNVIATEIQENTEEAAEAELGFEPEQEL